MWPPLRPGMSRDFACTATTSAATSSTLLPTSVAAVAPAQTAVAALTSVRWEAEYEDSEVDQMGENDDVEEKVASSEEESQAGDTAATSTEEDIEKGKPVRSQC